MTLQTIRIGHQLSARTIFLSASVPSQLREGVYLRVPNAAFQIDQAVISLASAIFSQSGQLVFGGHPSISPLVAMVAAEYREPLLAESVEEQRRPPIRIFQSRAYEGEEPQETQMMYRLGYAQLHWVDAVDGEKYNPEISDVAQCRKSLQAMRRVMIGETQPAAMVCIGGMEGVEREVEIFREILPKAPVFVLEKTGGASYLLGSRRSDVRVMDTPVLEQLRARRLARQGDTSAILDRSNADGEVIPYPLIMQLIVEEISHRKEQAVI